MKKRLTRVIIILLLIFLAGLLYEGPRIYGRYQRWEYERHSLNTNNIPSAPSSPTDAVIEEDTSNQSPPPKPQIETKKKVTTLPNSVIIRGVPFTSQAPYGKWDYTHEETCEEASVLMVNEYLKGRRIARLPKDEVEKKLQAIIAWEKQRFGSFEDTTSAQTAEIAKIFYGREKTYVKYNISATDIKKEIAAGRPVIVPAAGRMLKNPYFTPPGPVYHNLVIIGYTKDEFITNDPGLMRLGLGYHYPIQRVMNAIHDWTGQKSTIAQGRKAMIVVR